MMVQKLGALSGNETVQYVVPGRGELSGKSNVDISVNFSLIGGQVYYTYTVKLKF